MKDYADLQPHQQRVVDECNEISERAKKLSAFRETDTFRALDPEEIRRLNRQLCIVELYYDVLRDRMEAF